MDNKPILFALVLALGVQTEENATIITHNIPQENAINTSSIEHASNSVLRPDVIMRISSSRIGNNG